MAKITNKRNARQVARAESVGSLLRSAEVRQQVETIYAGMTTAARPLVLPEKARELGVLNRLADGAVDDLVRRQIDAGLDVVTDGEVRRTTFLSSFYDALDGIAAPPTRFQVHDDQGELVTSMFNDPMVAEPLRKSYSPAAEEATYLRSITDYPFKITLPAPSYFFLTQFVALEAAAYATRHEFVADALAIEKRLVADIVAAGARWIQFDFPVYPQLVDETQSGELLEALHESADSLLDKALAVDAEIVDGIPDDVTVALHLCRGNVEGGFWSGSLEPIAERLFNELPHTRYLFEWEDVAREGTYESIKYLPPGRIMAMGLVSTKNATVESEDEIVRRLDEAARYLAMEQLALCPQCGFETTHRANLVAAEDSQWRKLELIGNVADRIWGND